MARTPKRLHGPAALSNAASTKYTVPALTKTIIRHIHISNTSAGAVNFTMSIGADDAGTRLYDAYAIAAGQALDIFCYHVVDVGEIIQALGSVNNQLVLTINGDEVTLG